MSRNKIDSTRVYFELFNYLQSVGLQVNLVKVQQDAFRTGVLDYCGWRFSGGFTGISQEKIDCFKATINATCNKHITQSERGFIKIMNAKINGFGHHYKYGDVVGVYQKLDGYVRNCVRNWFVLTNKTAPTNGELKDLGLRSLYEIKIGKTSSLISKEVHCKKQEQESKQTKNANAVLNYYLEKISSQNVAILEQLKMLNRNFNSIK